jgi:hypothetical protein
MAHQKRGKIRHGKSRHGLGLEASEPLPIAGVDKSAGESAGRPLADRLGMTYIPKMSAIALRRPIAPLTVLTWLFRLGLLPALVFALSGDVQQFEASRDCRGAFGRGFSSGFDRYHCDLVLRKIGSDVKIRVPLPR